MHILVPKKTILERDILNIVCEYLAKKQLFFWRSNNIPVFGKNSGGHMTWRSMPRYSRKGIPDIIVIHEGMFIGIEIKRPNAKLRPDQITFQEECAKNNAIYAVVHSLEEAENLINQYI
jgi:hypothetical protein